MKSMTGQGRGECAEGGNKVTVELTSVNRRQSDIAVNLPRELESLESRIREEVHRRVSRGRLNAKVIFHAAEETVTARLRVNAPLARAYAQELRRLAKDLRLAEAPTLETLMRAPGVLQVEDLGRAGEQQWPLVRRALEKALNALVRMRSREGAHLARDLRQRMTVIRRGIARVRRRAPAVIARYRKQLQERIQNAGLEYPETDDERLLKELVYFADRSDISEELTRLESHVAQFESCLKSTEPVGRTLDFLAQEMNREVNTIGAKANDSLISREIVELKAELEKFREQVQNVE
jgi:uncharacterized protein (TIGR00255 family)